MIENRMEDRYPFDPTVFDGSQVWYPAYHIACLPADSPAADLHRAVTQGVRAAYKALVQRDAAVKRYWETGDRDDWFERDLMSEVLPTYLETVDNAELGRLPSVVDAQEATKVTIIAYDDGIIDLPDMVRSMITVAEAFTPEIKDQDYERERFFFKKSADRRALVALREAHLVTLRALRERVMQAMMK